MVISYETLTDVLANFLEILNGTLYETLYRTGTLADFLETLNLTLYETFVPDWYVDRFPGKPEWAIV